MQKENNFMKILKFAFFIFGILATTESFSAVHDSCRSYTDCDMLAACELFYQVKNAQSGITPNYDNAIADALAFRRETCGNYPDLFSQNIINLNISENPKIVINIDWDAVRQRLALNNGVNGEDLLGKELDHLMPWFGILVVKRGSLDSFANKDIPLVSSEYMARNKATFYPDNSAKPLGMLRGCTHGNHTAHDKDVVNRAAHITMDEQDSFWSGNDYYVYDSQDVYWGTAQLVGEIALAIVTFGASAAVSGGAAATQALATGGRAVIASSRLVSAVKLTNNATNLAEATRLLKAAQSGTSAAAVASRTNAVAAAQRAGVTFTNGAKTSRELIKIGNALEATATSIGAMGRLSWRSALFKPWRLVKPGIRDLGPRAKQLFGPGATWGQRVKRGAVVAGTTGIGLELIKAFGYSSATTKIGDVKFNSFGLLSLDNGEGKENIVSHGAWLEFSEIGEANSGDTQNEALAFAEAFSEDLDKINQQDPQCNVDIYVVQPGVKGGEVFYLIQNPAGSLRVNTK